MSLIRTYCDLSEVKRLLRSVINRESRIRFSSAYRDLKADSNNSGTILLSGVTFNNSFSAHETFTFTFTDSTSFSVTGDVLGTIGSGNRFADFEASEMFTVPSSNWSGAAITGDKVYITASSDISEEDGHQFVVDATRKINSKLERLYGTLSRVSFYDSTSVEVPDGIRFACSRYAAHFIFNSVFAQMSEAGQSSPVDRWRIEAEQTLDEYISSHGRGPIWKSRDSLVTEMGMEGVGDGVIEIDELPDNKNKEYER